MNAVSNERYRLYYSAFESLSKQYTAGSIFFFFFYECFLQYAYSECHMQLILYAELFTSLVTL